VTSTCRGEDNIKMKHKEVGFETVDWIHRVLDKGVVAALVNTVMNLLVHKRWEVLGVAKRLPASQELLIFMERYILIPCFHRKLCCI